MLTPSQSFLYSKNLAEQERLKLDASFSEVPFKDPDGIDEKRVNKLIKRLIPDFSATEVRIQENWNKIVGEDIARHTVPGGLVGKTLCIYVKGSVWLAELKRNHTKNLLTRINDFCKGDVVKEITFRNDASNGS